MSKYNFNSDPICPYCDYVNSAYDYELYDRDGDTSLVTCDNCEKEFEVTTHITTEYSTLGIECKKHKLKLEWDSRLFNDKDRNHYSRYQCIECKREYYDHDLHNGKYQKLNENQYEIIS